MINQVHITYFYLQIFVLFQADNLMLEAFGPCLPSNRTGELFMQTYLDPMEI